MAEPKRHHYVPEVILKRFTDEEGWLHLYSNRDKRTRRSRIRNAFCQGHLYSEVHEDGRKDLRVESELSWLESAIEPIFRKFEKLAISGQDPNLSALELLTWHFFFVVQWRRVPDLQNTVTTDDEAAKQFGQILDAMQSKYPDRVSEINALREPKAVARTVRNARISNVPEVSGRVMDAMATRGIAVLSIKAPTKSLIIGSRPVVQMAFTDGLSLLDEETEMWLPISSKLAIGIGKSDRREAVLELRDHAAIRRLNMAVARQSTEFASCSAKLTTSIALAR